jgi:quercetin dioxygenase-like cupin family protein
MKTLKVSEAETKENIHGVDARLLFNTENGQLIHLTLNPGEELRRHITPVDVFFYVLEGTGVVEIGDKKKTVESDTVIDSPAGIVHCWYNKSEDPLRILVGKVPRPTTKTIIL